MKNAKLMLFTALLFSASMASAAITNVVIDFESALTNANYAAFDSTSGLSFLTGDFDARGTNYGYISSAAPWGSNPIVISFDQQVRFDSFDLGVRTSHGSTWTGGMNIYGGSSGGDTLLASMSSGTSTSALTNYVSTDTATLFDSLKILYTSSPYGIFDNIAYNFGEEDPIPEPEPEPVPVPTPGAIVLAGIGSCIATWIRKRNLA
ncbi:MAG: hypothetical protein K9N55_04695 [Phycisphaerae bacterium]|nr:hypothetical protein [Phycisphaerae bacterium]